MKLKIKIPLIVTSDLKWAASGSHGSVNEPDWAWLDEMCDFENPTVNPQRYFIEAEVEVPETKTVEATAVAPAAE